jgi:hypothetical protein
MIVRRCDVQEREFFRFVYPKGFRVGWDVSEVREAFVTSKAGIFAIGPRGQDCRRTDTSSSDGKLTLWGNGLALIGSYLGNQFE